MMGRAMDLVSPHMLAIITNEASSSPLQSVLRQMSLPGMMIQTLADTTNVDTILPLSGNTAIDNRPTAYFCSGGTCSLPIVEPEALEDLLRSGREV
jgi:uncharacterized protein YyaL (SSP411 family)